MTSRHQQYGYVEDHSMVMPSQCFGPFSEAMWTNQVNNHAADTCTLQGLYSLSGKTSYRKISCSLEDARFGFKLFQSLWNLAGTSAVLPPRCPCQISERYDHCNIQSRGFEISRDLAVRRLTAWWIEALGLTRLNPERVASSFPRRWI